MGTVIADNASGNSIARRCVKCRVSVRAAYIVRVNDKSLVFAFVSHPHTDYGSYINAVYRVFGIGVVYKHLVRRNV